MRSTFAVWVIDSVLNAVWQLPLLFTAALVCARMVRRIGPEAEHRVWVGALLVSVVLPGCRFGSWPRGWWGAAAGAAGGHVQVAILPGVAGGYGGLRLGPAVMAVVLAGYAGTVVYFAVRLAWGLWRIGRVRREALGVELPEEMKGRWEGLRARMGAVEAELRVSASVAGPVVVGVRHRTLLAPLDFFSRVDSRVEMDDLEAALAHELAHLRRSDFAKNLVYTAVTVLVAYHPCAWMLQRRVAESREMVCDGMAARVLEGRKRYARSLLRLAMAMPAGLRPDGLPGVGIFDGNTLERRVVQMMDKRNELRGAARLAAVAGAVLLGSAVCASAVGLRMDVAAGAPASETAARPAVMHVKGGVMAGNALTKVQPEYPAKAKADHVEGTCTLGLIIDKEGMPTDIHILKTVRKDVDESTLTAVRQWRWKPYLLNGEPVAVQTTVNVTYSLEK